MKNKLDVNSKNSNKSFFEFLSQIENSFFHDFNLEMDFAQWWIFVKIWEEEKRYTREDLLLWLFNKKISLTDFISYLGLDLKEIKNFSTDEIQHLLLYRLLLKFNEDESNELFFNAFKVEKFAILWFYQNTEDLDKKKIIKQILWEPHPMNTTWDDIKNSVDTVLKK